MNFVVNDNHWSLEPTLKLKVLSLTLKTRKERKVTPCLSDFCSEPLIFLSINDFCLCLNYCLTVEEILPISLVYSVLCYFDNRKKFSCFFNFCLCLLLPVSKLESFYLFILFFSLFRKVCLLLFVLFVGSIEIHTYIIL